MDANYKDDLISIFNQYLNCNKRELNIPDYLKALALIIDELVPEIKKSPDNFLNQLPEN